MTTLKTPEQIVDEARLTAKKLGKVMLGEMMAYIDEVASQRCESMAGWIISHGMEKVCPAT
jgi:hypothetical protein